MTGCFSRALDNGTMDSRLRGNDEVLFIVENENGS